MTTGLGQNCVTRGRGPLEIPFCKPQIGAKTETWLENSWRRSDNIVGDLEENYGIWIHGWERCKAAMPDGGERRVGGPGRPELGCGRLLEMPVFCATVT